MNCHGSSKEKKLANETLQSLVGQRSGTFTLELLHELFEVTIYSSQQKLSSEGGRTSDMLLTAGTAIINEASRPRQSALNPSRLTIFCMPSRVELK